MSTVVSDEAVEAALAVLESAVGAFVDTSLDGCTDDDIPIVWQRLEALRRTLAVGDHTVIGQVQTRHLDHRHGAKNPAALARLVLRIGSGEARLRVANAEAAGTHRSLTGEVLAPAFPHVAAAQRAGEISVQHAHVITDCIDALPDAVQAEKGEWDEKLLVDHARVDDPAGVAKLATRILLTEDPDGRLRDSAYRRRRRFLDLHARADGSAHLEGELTAEAAEHLRTVLDSVGRPKPAADGAQDPRTAGQRRHDGLLDLLKLVERSATLPDTGGITTTVLLVADAADWRDGSGVTTTGHGVIVATEEARTWTDGETRFATVVVDESGAIGIVTDTRRAFTESQRLAMIVRDGGCSFPSCDAPPQWTEAHHVREHALGGRTTIDNGALLCGFHHREFQRMGWAGLMIDGVPHWIPPRWLDPDRTPQRNRMHRHVDDLDGG